MDSYGTKLLSMSALADELRKHGEESFRGKYPHAFLVVRKYPESNIEFMSPKTALTSVSHKRRPSIVKKGAKGDAEEGLARLPDRAVALTKSDRNAFTSKITVGRARNNDIIIRAAKVSKLHGAFIRANDGTYGVVDMGSANGTFVNGKRLGKNRTNTLHNGDQVAFCHHEFEFLDLNVFVEVLSALF